MDLPEGTLAKLITEAEHAWNEIVKNRDAADVMVSELTGVLEPSEVAVARSLLVEETDPPLMRKVKPIVAYDPQSWRIREIYPNVDETPEQHLKRVKSLGFKVLEGERAVQGHVAAFTERLKTKIEEAAPEERRRRIVGDPAFREGVYIVNHPIRGRVRVRARSPEEAHRLAMRRLGMKTEREREEEER